MQAGESVVSATSTATGGSSFDSTNFGNNKFTHLYTDFTICLLILLLSVPTMDATSISDADLLGKINILSKQISALDQQVKHLAMENKELRKEVLSHSLIYFLINLLIYIASRKQ